jgi:hypothetical protein
MLKKLITYIFALLLISSCSSIDEISEENVPNEANNYAKLFIEKLNNGEIDYCLSQINEQYQNEELKNFLLDFFESLTDKNPKDYSILAYRYSTLYSDNSITTYEFRYEYEYADVFAYFTFQLEEKEDLFQVFGFSIDTSKDSLRNLNQFHFKDKSIIHYIFLLLTIAVPIFILVSVVFAIISPIERKWAWILFILLGFITFTLNWTDGQIGFKLISLKLFGAGFTKFGIIEPWILSFAIPIGAIVFWVKRKSTINQSNQ